MQIKFFIWIRWYLNTLLSNYGLLFRITVHTKKGEEREYQLNGDEVSFFDTLNSSEDLNEQQNLF